MPPVNDISCDNNLWRPLGRNCHKIQWHFFSHHCPAYYMQQPFFLSFLPSQACLQNPVVTDDPSGLPILTSLCSSNFFFRKTRPILPVQKAGAIAEQKSTPEIRSTE